jgi:hypothetical protein
VGNKIRVNMKHFRDNTANIVYGFDENDPSEAPLIQKAIKDGWEDISSSWPPPSPPPPIPDVTAVQIRLELNRVGLRAQVEAAVAAGSQDLKDKWQFGNIFSSTDPDIQAMATALGLNQTELDVLFTNAANL